MCEYGKQWGVENSNAILGDRAYIQITCTSLLWEDYAFVKLSGRTNRFDAIHNCSKLQVVSSQLEHDVFLTLYFNYLMLPQPMTMSMLAVKHWMSDGKLDGNNGSLISTHLVQWASLDDSNVFTLNFWWKLIVVWSFTSKPNKQHNSIARKISFKSTSTPTALQHSLLNWKMPRPFYLQQQVSSTHKPSKFFKQLRLFCKFSCCMFGQTVSCSRCPE